MWLQDGKRWGAWELQKSTLVLEYQLAKRDSPYEVDLERCCSFDEILGWISQLSYKEGWVKLEDIRNLAQAFQELLKAIDYKSEEIDFTKLRQS